MIRLHGNGRIGANKKGSGGQRVYDKVTEGSCIGSGMDGNK